MQPDNHNALISVNIKSIRDLENLVGDFELFSQLITNKKVEVTDWVRERFKLPGNTTWTIEFGEMTIIDFLYIETQAPVLMSLVDEYPVGFGEGGFGEGGFGGMGAELNGFTTNGILCVEGRYGALQMTNRNSSAVVVDLFAAVYAQE